MKLFDLITNCSGLLFTTLTKTLELVGLYNYAKTDVETPKGDFKFFMIMGCLGLQRKFSSYSV